MSHRPHGLNVQGDAPGASVGFLGRAVRHPEAYLWLMVVATLDILLTSVILALGGREVNPIADRVLTHAGLTGMVFFKFAAMALVVCICEYIAHHRPITARRLAHFAVGISAVPVVLAAAQLIAYFYAGQAAGA